MSSDTLRWRERLVNRTGPSLVSGPVLTLERGSPVPARRSGRDERVSGETAREPGSGAWRWLLLGALLLVAVTVLGADYYFAPTAVRVRSPLHPWLRPSGYVGQVAGIVAILILREEEGVGDARVLRCRWSARTRISLSP